jgi:hypothetical protein
MQCLSHAVIRTPNKTNYISTKLLFVSNLWFDCCYFIFTVSLCFFYNSQNWGNYADMSQGVAIYITYTIDVLLICWFGTQLTKHVRKNTHCQSKNATCTVSRKIQHITELQSNLNLFILQCLRRRVWETLHSVATGWELLSDFRNVCCSSSLQLTRISGWQRESLFQCQIWPRWMYVCVWCLQIYIYIYIYIYICVCVLCIYVLCTYIFIRPSHPRKHKLHTMGFLITDNRNR